MWVCVCVCVCVRACECVCVCTYFKITVQAEVLPVRYSLFTNKVCACLSLSMSVCLCACVSVWESMCVYLAACMCICFMTGSEKTACPGLIRCIHRLLVSSWLSLQEEPSCICRQLSADQTWGDQRSVWSMCPVQPTGHHDSLPHHIQQAGATWSLWARPVSDAFTGTAIKYNCEQLYQAYKNRII